MVRYNVAPSQEVPVVRRTEDGENEILLMRWGLIPSWAREPRLNRPIINARSETLTEKPMFRRLVRQQRCLVPATGFFEWKTTDVKRPFFVHLRDSRVFAFAGLYDTWRDPLGSAQMTFTIVTTEPNALVKELHSRMPAILKREDEERWLIAGSLSAQELKRILSPYPSEEMETYEVGTLVNNPVREGPDVIAPTRRM